MASGKISSKFLRTQTLAGLVLSQRHQHNNPIIWIFLIAVGVLPELKAENYGHQGVGVLLDL